MKKTIIKTCSCFLENAIWFVNSSKSFPKWVYKANCYKTLRKDKIFILNERSRIFASDSICEIVHHTSLISCCIDCMRFQVSYETSLWNRLNVVECDHVQQDYTTYGDGYDNEVFIQDSQVIDEYYRKRFGGESERDESEEYEITFREKPFHKYCFTSSMKLRYKYFLWKM